MKKPSTRRQFRSHQSFLFIPAIAALFVAAFSLIQSQFTVSAAATLTVTPITWNIVGLDSNNVNSGPNTFPVGARICNTALASTTISSAFVWDTTDTYIYTRPGSNTSYTGIALTASGTAGACEDVYYEIQVERNSAAFGHTARYHITATDGSGTASSPTPRELFVERLISQNRNFEYTVKVDSVLFDQGTSKTFFVGNSYSIELKAKTATQGYNQIETFINLSNAVFQINSVTTTYTAFEPGSEFPDMLYADACGWDNNPASITYRSCTGSDHKNGGDITVTYDITIIDGAGTSQTLTTMIYDFSGSSYHYNSDYSASARIASVTNSLSLAKSFSPVSISSGQSSTLTLTLSNFIASDVSGVSLTDNLPSGVKVASPPSASHTCSGSPTFSPAANDTSISFSNATVPAAGCYFQVNVTSTTNGAYTNTTNNLYVNSVDTGVSASANLYVSDTVAGSGTCTSATLANWAFPSGSSTTAPLPSSSSVTASASIGAGLSGMISAQDHTGIANSNSWGTNGSVASGNLDTANNDYFQFALDTSGHGTVSLTFYARRTNNGPNTITVYYGTSATPPGTSAGSINLPTAGDWYLGSFTFNTGLSVSGTTYFRIYGSNAGNSVPGSDLSIDDVTFTGCGKPTLSKTFNADTILLNSTSTLTFTLSNPNTTQLTGAAFSDSLPSGLQVATTPSASNTCGATFSPSAGATSFTLSGGTIPVSGSCTAQVNVTATTAGPHENVTGFISTTQTGTNTGTGGSATDTLTAVEAPVIDKSFSPNPITPGGTSTLTFTISNPNTNDSLTSVSFTDTLPTSPANMVVANPPNASTSGCSSPTFNPSAGVGSLSFSGGTIAAGGTCIAEVNVTASSVGSYSNTSSAVTASASGTALTGNTASDTMVVKAAANPAIKMAKQVSNSSAGPWSSYRTLNPAVDNVYYRLIVENTGDVTLSSVTVTDTTLNMSGCPWYPTGLTSLAAGDTSECAISAGAAQSGDHINTASAQGTYGSATAKSFASAEYVGITETSSPGLTLYKQISYSSSGPWSSSVSNPGNYVYYRFTVINTGNAQLTSVGVTDLTLGSLSTCSFSSTLEVGQATACTFGPVTANTAAATYPNTATAQGTFSSTNYTSSSSANYTVTGYTSVLLSAFTAQGTHSGILLEWNTAQELTGAGFNLYRAADVNGPLERVNANLIPMNNPGMPIGAEYHLLDKAALPKTNYYYWLEVVLISGAPRFFGPVPALWQNGTNYFLFLPIIQKANP